MSKNIKPYTKFVFERKSKEQPYFDSFKDGVYNFLYSGNAMGTANFEVCLAILYSNIPSIKSGKLPKTFHTHKKEFFADLEQWLTTIDIRMVGSILKSLKEVADKTDTVKTYNRTFPNWLREGKYSIDMNEKGYLDLIPTKHLNESSETSESFLNIVFNNKDGKCFVNDRFWGKKGKGQDIGDYLINVLFYMNRDGANSYKITIDGEDETESFKAEVKKKYQDIKNTDLRDRFFLYSNIK